MKRIILMAITIFLISGCSVSVPANPIKPIEIIQSEFDLDEAEQLMLKAWKPAYDMTKDYVTMPKVKVKSFKEFLSSYDFSYTDEYFVEDTYFRPMAKSCKDNEMALDNEGYIIFDSAYHGTYIPTIYDARVDLIEAYYEDTIYDDEYSNWNEKLLKVKEASAGDIEDTLSGHYDGTLSGHYRTSVFKENDDGRWVLVNVIGILGYSVGN